MNLGELTNRLVSFDVDKTLSDIVFDLEDEILELNKSQIKKGENIDGSIIGIYKKSTELFSDGRKRSGDPYNLLDTGDFQRSFKLGYKNDQLIFYATDSKIPEIFKTIKKHGLINDPKSVFGLTVDKGKIVNFEVLLPNLQQRFNSHLQ